MTTQAALESAYQLLRDSIITYQGRPVGTVAAFHPDLPAENYQECFVRDFVPGAMVFLMDGEFEIVRNFLRAVVELHGEQVSIEGHENLYGLMPASFKVVQDDSGKEMIVPDFGDRAIGRVAPVDSMMWWVTILAQYTRRSGDETLAREPVFQRGLRSILSLLLRDSFEIYPSLLTPDGCFMIDRRMGVYGHPLEVQSLFYLTLRCMPLLLESNDDNQAHLELARQRAEVLRDYIREHYWLDLGRLNEIHRFRTEEFGHDIANPLNIYPESIPAWVEDWLPDGGGYLAGNVGPGRLDCRFFALGNLLAVLFNLASEKESGKILSLYEERWSDLVGFMPVKISYPALEGEEWRLVTGCDPKNVPWSYHNGGNWPCLLWTFTAAALETGRGDLAQRAFDSACRRLHQDGWPEYYDGKGGRLIGRRASFNQVWSASSLILSHKFLQDPRRVATDLFPEVVEKK
jgi:glycogen debranching enzyme